MIKFSDMTEDQQTRLERFIKKYDDTRIKIYSEMFDRQRRLVVNQPYYESYLNIIKRTAKLFKELKLDDAVTASIVFEYLLWNGYFSKDKELTYCVSGRVNNITITGADIMRGKSVCLNNADMLTRVLDETGIESYLLGCYLKLKKNQQREYRPPIERKRIEEKQSLFMKAISYPITKAIGNHAVTLAKLGDCYIVSDPTSLAFANVDVLKAKYIGVDNGIEIKPWLTFSVDESNKKEFVDAIIKSAILSDKKPLSLAKVKFLYESIIRLCQANTSLFEDFHEENHKDIDNVCKTLTKISYK